MASRVIEIENAKTGEVTEAVYEHPFIVRLCHWVNAVSLFVMVGSGLQIFRAFPSFGAKIPQKDLIHWPKAFALGGWLGGALQWHLTFMWIYSALGWCISAIRFSAGTISKSCSCRAIFPECGRWCGIIFSSGRSLRRGKPTTRCKNMLTLRPLFSGSCRCSLDSPFGSRCSFPGWRG